MALLCLCFVSVAQASPARHYTISGWNMEAGLPHPLVHTIAQDRDGFIWVGTWEGAARFNGRSFTVYDRQNSPAELSGVFSILPESDGGVLLGTVNAGVYRLFQGRWEHLGNDDAQKINVRKMLRDHRDGALWLVSGQRLLRLDAAGVLHDIGAQAGLRGFKITTIAQDTAGALLIAGSKGVQRLDGDHLTPWGSSWLDGVAVTHLHADGQGGWLAAGEDGVRWRHVNGRLEHFAKGQRVDRVALDREGVVWMAMASGILLRHEDGRDQPANIPGTLNPPALIVDREGLVWTGSTDGLYRVAEGVSSSLTRADGLRSDFIRVVMQDDAGAIWVGEDKGLNRVYQGRVEAISVVPRADGQQSSMLAFAKAHDGIWVGTYDQGVFKLDQQGRLKAAIKIGSGRQPLIRSLLETDDGSLWIGGAHGLIRVVHGEQQVYLSTAKDPRDVVQVLLKGAHGELWVGLANGMAMIDAKGLLHRWLPGRDIPAQNVFDFLQDPNGDLWVASDRGLLRMRGNKFSTYDHLVGMPRDKVFRILDDSAGSLWLSSNIGVFRIARSEFDRLDEKKISALAVHVVDESDGMPGNQCNGASMPAGWRAQNGTLLFPTSSGIAVIDPSSATRGEKGIPKVALESIAVDGVPQRVAPFLQLRSSDGRVQVGFAGLSFRAPDKLRYRYRLQGYDRDWVENDSGNEAVYTRLPPGRYVLQIESMALPLDWAKRHLVGTTQLEIDVQPALWQKTWVKVLISLGMLLFIGMVLWWRNANYRRAEQKLNRVIAERTEELSEKNRQLEIVGFQLQFQASHDDLTGLPNRRAGDKFLNECVAQAHAQQTPLSIALLDIDHFKWVNDRHGHPAGDAVLQRFAEHLAAFAAEYGAFVARFGGEEFLICMEAFSAQKAVEKVHELLADVASATTTLDNGQKIAVTFSAGVTELKPEQTAHALFACVDALLLKAKQAGRNQVISE